MSSLAARLAAERNRKFVGREQEISVFKDAISATELPFNILYIYGPGGVGKTTLLSHLQNICREDNIEFIALESRNLEPTPDSFLDSLNYSLASLAAKDERLVIFIDNYEKISVLDDWLREEFLPQLSLNTLVVLAGRNSPHANWRSDPGWQSLIHILPLRNLNNQESFSYLSKRNIPATQHQKIIDFTYGYPLALSLVADVLTQEQEFSLQIDAAPDIIKTLLERFIQDVPTPVHRLALQACAVVRITTEAVLGQMLDSPDIANIFEWLRGLSFIESGQLGLFPHDLAREVLIADLRWRNPDLYTRLHQLARNYYSSHLGQAQGQEKHRILFDYMFLHRDNTAIRPRFIWGEHSSLQTDSLRETDKDAILEILSKYEGKESGKIATHWLKKQPQNVVIFRDSQPQPAGFTIMVALHEASLEDIKADPGAIAAWEYLQNYTPLRPQEGATVFRFWMARDTYQATSPTQSLIFVNFVQYFQKTPGLAYTFLPCADVEAWDAMLTYFDLHRLPAADFTVAGCKYGVYGHDWRIVSPGEWQQLLAQKEVNASVETANNPQNSQPLLVLSQTAFIEAVKSGLRNFNRADVLQKNPLIRSRIVEEQVTDKGDLGERVATLQQLIQQAVESLQLSPRDEKLYRVLYRTYLHPAPTQEQAAELLDLPFSTYRRHLKAGMVRVANILWQKEIN
ncbi:MAG: AAA family ATPase [Nostocaceae cyanobacterium]|nr:AAA family ATPase [Nostocaceae cyanobacterium]